MKISLIVYILRMSQRNFSYTHFSNYPRVDRTGITLYVTEVWVYHYTMGLAGLNFECLQNIIQIHTFFYISLVFIVNRISNTHNKFFKYIKMLKMVIFLTRSQIRPLAINCCFLFFSFFMKNDYKG